MTDFSALGLIYLGTPYTRYTAGIDQAFIDAAKIAARLLSAGAKVYSPIVHGHPMALHGGLDPLDLNIWLPFDEAMMSVCDCLMVAKMAGWEDSFGIKYEIKEFYKADKPIWFLDPVKLELTSVGQTRSAVA